MPAVLSTHGDFPLSLTCRAPPYPTRPHARYPCVCVSIYVRALPYHTICYIPMCICCHILRSHLGSRPHSACRCILVATSWIRLQWQPLQISLRPEFCLQLMLHLLQLMLHFLRPVCCQLAQSGVQRSTYGAQGHEEPSLPRRLEQPNLLHHDRIVRPPPHGLPIVECQLCGTEWTIVSGDQGMDRDYECRNNRCSFCDVPLVGKGLGKGRSALSRPCGASQCGVQRSTPLSAPQQAVLQERVQHGQREQLPQNLRVIVDNMDQDRMRLPRIHAGSLELGTLD